MDSFGLPTIQESAHLIITSAFVVTYLVKQTSSLE